MENIFIFFRTSRIPLTARKFQFFFLFKLKGRQSISVRVLFFFVNRERRFFTVDVETYFVFCGMETEISSLRLQEKVQWLLTLSLQRSLSYKNQSSDLHCKWMDWFLYDKGLHHERFKSIEINGNSGTKWMNLFHLSIVVHIGSSHLFCSWKQMTGFYMKRNTRLK